MADQDKRKGLTSAGAKGHAASTGDGGTAPLDTPLTDGRITIGPLEREMGETPDLATPAEQPGNLLADGLSADQREERGIIDESRHTGSLGSR